MDKLMFTAMSGATRVMISQQVHANNLANVNTPGFRADIDFAETFKLQGEGYHTRSLVAARSGGVDLSEGSLQHTDNVFDVAIRGQGFFAVEAGENDEAYTRSGSFRLSPDGALLLGDKPVMGLGGPIVIPAYSQLDIGSDGTISIVPLEGGLVEEVDQLKLIQPEPQQIYKSQDGLFRATAGEPIDANEGVVVASRYRENSNVNAIDSLIQNMSMSRNFEFQIKMMKTAEELASAGNRLIRT